MRLLCILIAILIGIDNVFINYKVVGISYDRLLELLLFACLFKSFLRELKYNRFFRIVNIFFLVFLSLQLFVDIRLSILGSIDPEKVFRDIARYLAFVSFSYLFIFIIKKNIKFANIILFCHFLWVVFAVLQHPLSPVSNQVLAIRQQMFASVEKEGLSNRLQAEEAYIESGEGTRFRVSGPFHSPIALAYLMINSLFLSYYMYVKTKKKGYLSYCIFLFMVSLLTQTRSLMWAELAFVSGIFFFNTNMKTRILSRVAAVFSLLLLITLVISSGGSDTSIAEDSTRLTRLDDKGSDRPLLWLTGLTVVTTHPFGFTDDEYYQVKRQMYMLYKSPAILAVETHNGLIAVGFDYSIFGYIAFFFFAFQLFRFVAVLNDRIRLTFMLFFGAYMVNSFFHNNFIFSSDYEILLAVMLVAYEYGHFKSQQRKIQFITHHADESHLITLN